MAALKTAKCVKCGGIVLKLRGKASGLCYDTCFKCRRFDVDNAAARTLTEEPNHDE